MTREQKYMEQMQALGIWQDAFLPAVKELAGMERELQRLQKRWRERGCPVETIRDPLYPSICALRRDILSQRDALGLTPKGLKRFRAQISDEPEREETAPTVLKLVQERHRKDA